MYIFLKKQKSVFGIFIKKKANNLVHMWAKDIIRQFTKETLASCTSMEKVLEFSCDAHYNHHKIIFHSISLEKNQYLTVLSFGEM